MALQDAEQARSLIDVVKEMFRARWEGEATSVSSVVQDMLGWGDDAVETLCEWARASTTPLVIEMLSIFSAGEDESLTVVCAHPNALPDAWLLGFGWGLAVERHMVERVRAARSQEASDWVDPDLIEADGEY